MLRGSQLGDFPLSSTGKANFAASISLAQVSVLTLVRPQEGELSRPFEAGPARHVLHDALHPIMGELQVPEGRAFEFTEFPTAGGAAQHKA